MQRIFVDFNSMNQDLWSDEPRILLGRDIASSLVRQGTRVIVGDEDLEVEARLECDPEHGVWWARPEWSTRRDLYEVPTPSRKASG